MKISERAREKLGFFPERGLEKSVIFKGGIVISKDGGGGILTNLVNVVGRVWI